MQAAALRLVVGLALWLIAPVGGPGADTRDLTPSGEAGGVAAAESPLDLRIDVLAVRGEPQAMARWTSTADYLNQALPSYRFSVLPLSYEEVVPAARLHRVDLLVVNPAVYIQAEVEAGAMRIATLKNRVAGHDYDRYGGVVFTRADRTEIATLADLAGRQLGAVAPNSLGGYLALAGELVAQGLDPARDLKRSFLGTQDAVVDAGTVRTDQLERMAAEGSLDLAMVRLVAPRQAPGFGLRLSTRLYPEWPLAALPHLDLPLVEAIARSLLAMGEGLDQDAEIGGWTLPAHYSPVQNLLEELGEPPFQRPVPTLRDTLRHYWPALALVLAALLIAGALVLYLARLNRRLATARDDLSRSLLRQGRVEQELRDGIEALNTSQETFRRLTEAARDAIVMADGAGLVTYWNVAAERLFGYGAQEVLGTDVHQWLAPPEQRLAAAAGYAGFAATGTGPMIGVTRELDARHRDGHPIPVEISIAALGRHDHWGTIAILRDISERRQAEELLRREQARAEMCLNSAGSPIVALDREGRIVLINEAMARVLGRARAELLGRSWIDGCVAPASREAVSRLFRDCGAGDGPAGTRRLEYQVLDQTGQPHDLVWDHVPVRDPGGAPDGVLASGLDVTETRHMAHQLRQLQTSLTNLVAKNRSGILVVGCDGVIRFSNPAAQKSLGRSAEDLVGLPFGYPSTATHTEMEILLPDGGFGVAEVTATQTEWDDQPAHLVMLHDITDRKRAEEQVRHQALHDALTGLPNRTHFLDRLNLAIDVARRQVRPLAVLFLDLDRFKAVNCREPCDYIPRRSYPLFLAREVLRTLAVEASRAQKAAHMTQALTT